MIDFSQRPHYLRWAERVLGVSFAGHPATWLTQLDQRGTILGVVVFSNFNQTGCEVTLVVPEPKLALRSLYYAAMCYLFTQCDYRRVTAIIAVDNDQSISLAQRLGFRNEGRVREWFPTGDAFVFGLLRSEFKWLKDRHAQPLNPAGT